MVNTDGTLASAVRALSPGVVQVSHKIVLGKDDADDVLTISLVMGKDCSVSRAGSPAPLATAGTESRSRKRKREKKKKK